MDLFIQQSQAATKKGIWGSEARKKGWRVQILLMIKLQVSCKEQNLSACGKSLARPQLHTLFTHAVTLGRNMFFRKLERKSRSLK